MKKLFAISALFVSFAAHAATYEAANDAGGKIVLTERACVIDSKTYNGWFSMYATAPSGTVYKGCWTYIDKRIQVVFSDGAQRIYEPEGFDKVE
jgi:hypothetical protein